MLTCQQLAMIGCGSMGGTYHRLVRDSRLTSPGGMALLFAGKGLHVSLSDPSEEAMDKIMSQARESGFGDRVQKPKVGSRLTRGPIDTIRSHVSLRQPRHVLEC